MDLNFNSNYPSIDSLRQRARQKMPGFAFDYIDGGCNELVNLDLNTKEIRDIKLKPQYLSDYGEISMKTELFGEIYDAPFGISPVGLQGLAWPNAPQILAKAAIKHNIPYVLSTVSTESIEKIAEITEGKAWFQLYNPVSDEIREDIMKRCEAAGIKNFVILTDVPKFGYRHTEIKNGLTIPPKMTLRNIAQIMSRPQWAAKTLIHGQPEFKTIKKYMPKDLDLSQIGLFMQQTFDGRLNQDDVKKIRDRWKGNLIIKGVESLNDAQISHDIGLDGIIISNHGGRQLDAAESTIVASKAIVEKFKGKMTLMMDSGIRTGPDVARVLASDLDFCFMGKSFMYGVGALGEEGGNHTITILKNQLDQIMRQLCCDKIEDLPKFLIKD